MRVIDLLNKIANGEEVPEKIKFSDKIFEWYNWSEDIYDYVWSGCEGLLNGGEYDLFAILDKEVEIIEEDKEMEKGIKPFGEYWEEIKMAGCDMYEAKIVYLDRLSKLVIELREAINELKKGK